MTTKDIKEIEAITGAKVVAATKENSSFNSDFVLLDDNAAEYQLTSAYAHDLHGDYLERYNRVPSSRWYNRHFNFTRIKQPLNITTMQTIKVNTESTANGCEFTTGYKAIATIRKDTNGTFWARFQAYASANNLRTFPDAVEFISDAIENHFAAFGLNVEFINA